jgi:hypothetical protein
MSAKWATVQLILATNASSAFFALALTRGKYGGLASTMTDANGRIPSSAEDDNGGFSSGESPDILCPWASHAKSLRNRFFAPG